MKLDEGVLEITGRRVRPNAATRSLPVSAAVPEPPQLYSVDEIFDAATRHFIYAEKLAHVSSFDECPLISKDDLYRGIEAARRARDPLLLSCYWSPSNGTGSSRSLFFPTDIRENRFARERLAEHLVDARFLGPQHVCLNLHAGSRMYRAMEVYTELGERCGATVLPLGDEASDDDAIYVVEGFGVNTLIGAPQRLERLAETILAQGRTLPVATVLTGCDTLTEAARRTIQRATGARQFIQLFGAAETGVWGYQPSSLESTSSFYFDPLMMHVEVLDKDEDGCGRIVLTSLTRYTHPLLRYDCGDRGRVEVREVDGEERHILTFAGRDSRSFSLADDVYFLDDIEGALAGRASRYQLHLSCDARTRTERVDVFVVAAKPTAGLGAAFLRDLRAVCPAVTTLQVVRVDQLRKHPRTGKVQAIIDRRS